MRSHHRLIVLGVFIAVGVGLAISVALSKTPTRRESADTSWKHPSGRTYPDVTTASKPSRHDSAVAHSTTVNPSAATGGYSAGRAKPIYATAYPALADDRDTSTKSISAGPLLKALLGEKNETGSLESIPAPPAFPSSIPAQPETKPPKNSIRRTGREGDGRFAINILDADIREVLDLLSREGRLNILASPSVQGKVSATLSDVGLDSALDAILKSTGFLAKREGRYLFVGKPEDFVQMARTSDQINTRVYHPNYVSAAELQSLITPILTQGVGIVSVTTAAGAGVASADASGDSYAGSDAILVRDYEAVLQEIDQLVVEVDLRPLQVHIEAMILSVKLDDTNKFGVNFQLLRQFQDLKFGWGTIPDKLADVDFDGGLKFGFLDGTLGSFINALETVGDTNVISTPRLMVLNKHAAEIQIGKQKGYLDTTTQTVEASTQSVAFLDLGTILRIRPFVSSDGMIRLEVHPEISDGDITDIGGVALPEKELTQVTTNIMVRDGCTAVIGGLIQDKQEVDRSQIPLLGSLPLIGVLFREKDEDTDRHELIILITPNVVSERQAYCEGAKGACEFQHRQSVYAEKMSPIGKRSLARKYVRRAKTIWAEGNRRKALRMAELAVHFDPLNREAIELRSDIWLGKPYGMSCPDQQGQVHPSGAMDGPQVAPWVLEQLGTPGNSTYPRIRNPLRTGPSMPTGSSEEPTHDTGIMHSPSS